MAFMALLLSIVALSPAMASSADDQNTTPINFPPAGAQEVGLSTGWFIPHRLTKDHTSKPQGAALLPFWGMVLNDPVGERWYHGQVTLGGEVVYVAESRPFLTYGIGFTPRLKYTFLTSPQWRPYVEFGGGPYWTGLGERIPEMGSQFNFILQVGFGLTWFVTSQTAFNVGYRFHHISNAGLRYPNLGINSSLPLFSFSFYF